MFPDPPANVPASEQRPLLLPSLRCCTATARTLLPHSPQAAAERAESCRRSGSGRLCPRIFTFDSIPQKFGGNSDRRHDPHAERASPHTCAHPSSAQNAQPAAPTLCFEAQPARSLLSSTHSTRQPNALHRSTARSRSHSRPCGAAQPPQGPYSPTRRWQQRSGRNHAGETAAVAIVPEFLPSIPFPKNSGATAIGGMIGTRSGLPRTHALIRRTLYSRNQQRQRSASKHKHALTVARTKPA
ncbi:hypothetical protein [Paenibacillus sp. PSB04]|uniref:hypothetical protein n=1 Tax=Paenibacillus sp. PSB04 TaxID=2866810 RepID=UPI0021F163AC|nr:hypothetical protein [Paenibacillus sp. PSB04]UYO04468.1 hypothetical protein K2F33_00055 [Paenibacillus sp. PSB04]